MIINKILCYNRKWMNIELDSLIFDYYFLLITISLLT